NERQTAKDLADEAIRRDTLRSNDAARQASQAATDAARQSTDAYRNMTAAETARHNRAMEAQGQERIDKPAAASKLPPAEEGTVVAIHQMSPLIDQLLGDAQARIQAKGGPSGMVGQLKERVTRGGQNTLYQMGIANQNPEVDKRQQLASLLEVMGTVPW